MTLLSGNGLSTTDGDVELAYRSDAIIMAYWKQVLVIEEDAVILPVQYVEIQQQIELWEVA